MNFINKAAERKYLIACITRRQGANIMERTGKLHNGRKLNRLSTKQLQAYSHNQNKRLTARMMNYAQKLVNDRTAYQEQIIQQRNLQTA